MQPTEQSWPGAGTLLPWGSPSPPAMLCLPSPTSSCLTLLLPLLLSTPWTSATHQQQRVIVPTRTVTRSFSCQLTGTTGSQGPGELCLPSRGCATLPSWAPIWCFRPITAESCDLVIFQHVTTFATSFPPPPCPPLHFCSLKPLKARY